MAISRPLSSPPDRITVKEAVALLASGSHARCASALRAQLRKGARELPLVGTGLTVRVVPRFGARRWPKGSWTLSRRRVVGYGTRSHLCPPPAVTTGSTIGRCRRSEAQRILELPVSSFDRLLRQCTVEDPEGLAAPALGGLKFPGERWTFDRSTLLDLATALSAPTTLPPVTP